MAIARPVTKTIISTVDFGIPVVDQLNTNTTDIAALKPGPWVNVTFQNGWSNFNVAQYDPCQYRKVGDTIQIRGVIKGGGPGTVAFTLPVGYRPLKTNSCVVSSPPSNPTNFPSLSIDSGGSVLIYDVVNPTTFLHIGMYQFSMTA